MGRRPHATGGSLSKDAQSKSARDRPYPARLALIPEDRQRDGLVATLSVAANLTMASLHKFLFYSTLWVPESESRSGAQFATSPSKSPLRRRKSLHYQAAPAKGRYLASANDRSEGAFDG